MKSSPSVSSSDLEQARAIAGRLVGAPGAEPMPADKRTEYVSFKARGAATPPTTPRAAAPAPPPARPSPAVRPAPPPPAPPRPQPVPFEAEVRVEPPAARPEPPLRPTPAPTPAPRAAAPPRPAAPAPPPPPPPQPPAPETESVFEMDDGAGIPPQEGSLGVIEDDPAPVIEDESAVPEPAVPELDVPEPAIAEPAIPEPALAASLEFDEDIADVAAAAVGAVDEPLADAEPAPTWAQILDDAIYLAHARCALVMNVAGQVHESRGNWPPNTLDKVAARLLRGIEQAGAPQSPDATQLVEIQLGSFFLTGVRVVLQGSPVVVGFLSQAPLKREARPGLEAEIKRGMGLA